MLFVFPLTTCDQHACTDDHEGSYSSRLYTLLSTPLSERGTSCITFARSPDVTKNQIPSASLQTISRSLSRMSGRYSLRRTPERQRRSREAAAEYSSAGGSANVGMTFRARTMDEEVEPAMGGGGAASNEADSDDDEGAKKGGLEGDYFNVAILLLLYTLQGVPMGLSASVPLILQEKGATFLQQAQFDVVSYPFSMKLLWAPLVDSLYVARFGRRKTWLIPVQLMVRPAVQQRGQASWGSRHVCHLVVSCDEEALPRSSRQPHLPLFASRHGPPSAPYNFIPCHSRHQLTTNVALAPPVRRTAPSLPSLLPSLAPRSLARPALRTRCSFRSARSSSLVGSTSRTCWARARAAAH